ncbi:MAG: hypothetical protein Q9186_001875 [Xanthomendoza sp. 1 TL-2023]
MASVVSQRDSSPDPLGISQDSPSPIKSRSRRTPPRKALNIATGNAPVNSLQLTTPSLSNLHFGSPGRKDSLNENESSPWQIRITVQAEQNKVTEGRNVPQCSPSKQFVERTFTTTVPLRSGDESLPVRKKTKGTPRKLRNTSSTPKSASRSPAGSSSNARVGVPADHPARKPSPSPSPKRNRGRPRKSVDSVGTVTSTNSHSSRGHDSQPPASVDVDHVNQSPHKTRRSQAKGSSYEKTESLEAEDEHEDFDTDSVLESEGFSMISISSLPSAQGSSRVAADSRFLEHDSPVSAANRHVTPSVSKESTLPPQPPQPIAVQLSNRELDKPTSGTPKLARVVRAGIALQGVLSPSRQSHTAQALAPWVNHSSPLSSAASPKERLDELFSGFGPGTRRELRAGLRLGEELAKRQKPEMVSPLPKTNEDVFDNDPEVRYPQLPNASNYSLKVPDTTRASSTSLFNSQLPSPARSEVDVDDDRMSWKFDTIQSNAVQAISAKESAKHAGYAESSPISRTMLEKEAEYQREREATSKQIQDANSSQVIIVDSDGENDSSLDADLEDDGDIWQQEAQGSSSHQSTSDIPPVFLQNDARKPRRSQLPSPWMRKSQSVLDSSAAPSDSDRFWQPSHVGVREQANTSAQKGTVESKTSNSSVLRERSFSADGASDDVDEDFIGEDSKSPVQVPEFCMNSQTVEPGQEEQEEDGDGTEKEEELIQQQKTTVLHQSFDRRDSEDSYYEAKGSDDSMSDDGDLESTLLSHHIMQEDCTSPLEEDNSIDTSDAHISTEKTTTGVLEEEVPQPQTPSCLVRTPKQASSKKVVRFTKETKKTSASSNRATLPQPAPLPPASYSWFSRVTSLIPTWGASAPAAVPLPSRSKKIVKLSSLDVGPLPCYMPWEPCHWWALISICRQQLADPTCFPYLSKSPAASWLSAIVSVNQWSKKITKNDCAVVERFMQVLRERGTFTGTEEAISKGGKAQWGKVPGQWIDRRTVLSAVVAQWAVDVQDGVAEIGWGDKAGLKTGTEVVWTKADLEVDGSRVVYVP